MVQAPAIWIKDPIGIFAEGAVRGVVVCDGRIVELVQAGQQPSGDAAIFTRCGAARADQHQSSFLPDADACRAGRDGPRVVSLAAGALSCVDAADAGVTRTRRHGCDVAIAGVGLYHDDGPPICLSCRARGAVDIEVGVAKRLGMRVLLPRGLDEPHSDVELV